MKIIEILYTVFICFLLNVSCPLTAISQETYPFKVGFAKKVITPTDSAFIAGHSHNRKFIGVYDDIYVKAMVIYNHTDTMALLTFDCIGLLHPQLLEIRELVTDILPSFPADNITMSSTHTHSGPDVVGLWGTDLMHSGVDHDYINFLVKSAAQCIEEAWTNTEPCRGQYAISDHGEDWVYNISEPGELDRSLTSVRFVNAADKNVVTLTNFACHPTFLDVNNDRVSSDYIGGYYRTMDSIQSGGNMFLQGAIGGWVQPEHEENTHKQAFFRGDALAEKVLLTLNKALPVKGLEINFTSSKFTMPLENKGFVMLSNAGVLKRDFGDSVHTEIAFFKIGNISFATHPGETVPEFSLRTKELMSNDGPRLIMGLGMDALGYILKPYFFDSAKNIPHSKYLCGVSLGAKTQECIYKELKFLIGKE